jgi:hypothetical protein
MFKNLTIKLNKYMKFKINKNNALINQNIVLQYQKLHIKQLNLKQKAATCGFLLENLK